MIAIIVTENGEKFKVVHQDGDGKIVDVTSTYKIFPMAITVGDDDIIGFHIGFVKPVEKEAAIDG